MDAATVETLLALNRRFYERHAASFSRSRELPWPGWQRLLACLDRTASSLARIADIGCGNGRFAAFLAARSRRPRLYLGLDASPTLLADARQRLADEPWAAFHELDVVQATPPARARSFDLVVAFGLLHHVPGLTQRCRLLGELAALVAPGGVLAVTLWRFDRDPRWRRRRVAWDTLATPPGPDQLEPGDHLLSWNGDHQDPRYCHLASPEEIATLLSATPLPCREGFTADGPSGEENLYLLFQERPKGRARATLSASPARIPEPRSPEP